MQTQCQAQNAAIYQKQLHCTLSTITSYDNCNADGNINSINNNTNNSINGNINNSANSNDVNSGRNTVPLALLIRGTIFITTRVRAVAGS